MVAQYFAQLDDNNVVISVHVVTAEFMAENPERYPNTWVETFIDTAGKQYAGIGMEYLPSTKNFRPQQPFASWTWANNTWNPPTPIPSTGGPYKWNEAELAWVAL
jgi:hypothetical protein